MEPKCSLSLSEENQRLSQVTLNQWQGLMEHEWCNSVMYLTLHVEKGWIVVTEKTKQMQTVCK